MKITEKNETPIIEINLQNEHGRAHCHVGTQNIKVYVFSDGIVPEIPLTTKDLEFIYGYYNKMISVFKSMNWEVTPCPDEYRNSLFNG